jgi:hypothetical protein
MQPITTSYPLFHERSGEPLENGYIYIGTSGLDAVSNQVAVYWDSAKTQQAAQPIRTLGGYPSNNGSPAMVYVDADDYSLEVQDKNSARIYSTLSDTKKYFNRTLIDKLGDVIDPKDYGAVGDGVADDTAAVIAADQAAALTNTTLTFTDGTYYMIGDYTFQAAVSMKGGSIYSSDFMAFSQGFTSDTYRSLKTRISRLDGKRNVIWWGALGDGSGNTPADTGDDIENEIWNTWNGTAFKDNLSFSPYNSGGVFVPPRNKPFLNTDTWDYIGISMTMWSALNVQSTTYIPAGDFIINVGVEDRGDWRGLLIMRTLEQVIVGDGQYSTKISPKEDAAFFVANNTGTQNYYSLFNFYRNGGVPTSIKSLATIGPSGYDSNNDNLTHIHCENINGVRFDDLWLTVGSRGISADTSSGDSHMTGCTSEFLFDATVYLDATSEINVDWCNFFASASVSGQYGIWALGRGSVSNTRFIGFVGPSFSCATGFIIGCSITGSAENIAVSVSGDGIIANNFFDTGAAGFALNVTKDSSVTGNFFRNSTNHPCINCGDGAAAGSATNIVITGNTFIQENGAVEAQNYAITAFENGVGYTSAATASMFITSNTFQGRALTSIGSATIKSNIFAGAFVA